MVGRDEAENFLVTGSLPLFNGKNEAFKPKNTVPTVNQGGGGFDVFGLFFRLTYSESLRRLMASRN